MTDNVYIQETGEFYDCLGTLLGVGYAGHDDGVNNHDMQYVVNEGPIPVGRYIIGEAFEHPHAGPITMRLTPCVGTDTHGRDGFLIHGDTITRNRSASNGCVVQDHDVRVAISKLKHRYLMVVATREDRPLPDTVKF